MRDERQAGLSKVTDTTYLKYKKKKSKKSIKISIKKLCRHFRFSEILSKSSKLYQINLKIISHNLQRPPIFNITENLSFEYLLRHRF